MLCFVAFTSGRQKEQRMPEALPALSLVAVPGRRRLTLDIACEAERRGFAGIYVPSIFGNMAQCTALALATERIEIGTAIAPIYARTVEDFAHSAAYLHAPGRVCLPGPRLSARDPEGLFALRRGRGGRGEPYPNGGDTGKAAR